MKTDKYRIAVLGLSPLQEAGLATILSDTYPSEIIHASTTALPANCDCWISVPDKIIANLDFFSARKDRVMVLTDEQEAHPFAACSPGAMPDEIISSVGNILSTPASQQTYNGTLSTRETDVLRCLASGMTAKEIAEKLCISTNTVTTHRKNISSKLGIRTISGLSLYALMNGIV